MMDSIEIKLITSNLHKLLVWFRYQVTVFTVQLLDKICLFESERGCLTPTHVGKALASVSVGNPRGHWSEGSGGKAGQVTLDISEVTLSHKKSYHLCYVKSTHSGQQETIVASVPLSVRASDGALVECQGLPSGDLTCASGNTSIDTNSYDFASSEQPSSSFVVVSERDSQPIEPEMVESAVEIVSEELQESHLLPNHQPPELYCVESTETEPVFIPSPEDLIAFSPEASIASSPASTEPKPKETNPSVQHEVVEGLNSECSVPPEMSLSVNMGGEKFITQREALMHKNANKDLMQKIKKLTAIMQEMQDNAKSTKEIKVLEIEIEKLKQKMEAIQLKLTETEEQLAVERAERLSVQEENKSLKKTLSQVKEQAIMEVQIVKRENESLKQTSPGVDSEQMQQMITKLQSLKKENETLIKKVTQLTVERDTQFARSSTLLSELQDKEQEYEVLRSENLVLQGRLKRLETDKKRSDSKKQKESDQRKAKELDPRIENHARIEPVRKPVHQPPARPLENGVVREKEPQGFSNRPTDLPLAGGAKLKAIPQPAASNQQSRSHDHRRHQQAPLEREPAKRPPAEPSSRQLEQVPRSDHVGSSQGTSQRQGEERRVSKHQVEEIAHSLRGAPTVVCPICQKVLHARENEYSVLLHVEHCLSRAS